MQHYKNEATDALMTAISRLENAEECYSFFEDLCTIKELQEMAQRLETAALLEAGNSYQKISEKLGISTATISRVNRCLQYGAGGYRLVLDAKKDNGDQL